MPTRRWRRGSRASSWSAVFTTPVARRASRRRSSAWPPVDSTSPARRSRSPEAWRCSWPVGRRTRSRRPLEQTLARTGPAVENWDTRAALLWVLVATERFDAVGAALEPMLAEVHRSGSARGFVAAYSTLGLLKLRLGALPEADAAARVALRVLQEGDFAPGLAFAATVLADVAVEAGELDEAQALLDLLPQDGLARRRGHGAHPSRAWTAAAGPEAAPPRRSPTSRPASRCSATTLWGMQTRETGYVHARSGAALALLRLGQRDRACEMAEAELADVRVFGAPRALGVALRVAGLARGGEAGLALLGESVAALAWLARAARARPLPGRARRGAAPVRRTRRRARTSCPGARPRRPMRRPTTGGARRATSSRPPAPARDARGARAWKR